MESKTKFVANLDKRMSKSLRLIKLHHGNNCTSTAIAFLINFFIVNKELRPQPTNDIIRILNQNLIPAYLDKSEVVLPISSNDEIRFQYYNLLTELQNYGQEITVSRIKQRFFSRKENKCQEATAQTANATAMK